MRHDGTCVQKPGLHIDCVALWSGCGMGLDAWTGVGAAAGVVGEAVVAAVGAVKLAG